MEEYYSNPDDWANEYDPIMEEGVGEKFYDIGKEERDAMFEKLNELASEQGNNTYQHLWTRVDDEHGKLILLNGAHTVNFIDYCITNKPWGTGDKDTDGDIYIKVEYEDCDHE